MTTDPLSPTGLLPDNIIPIAEQIARNAERWPDRIALQSVEDGGSLTWAALQDSIARIVTYLGDRNIAANDRIAVLGENSLRTLILYFGIQAYGATYCTINTEINRNHLDEMLARIAPKLVLRENDFEGFFEGLAKLSPQEHIAPVNGSEDRCVISFTSGTADVPKGVLHSFCNYQAIAEHQIERWSLTPEDRILEFRSFSWASAHMLSLNPVLLCGGTLLFARRFSRSRFAGWIRDYQPSVIIAVPTVVNMLLKQPLEDAKTLFGTVRFVSCSTAPLMADAHRRFEELYGVRLVQLYGMSEGGVVCANTPEGRVIGSVGRAGLYQNITIIGDSGQSLPPGEIGGIETISAQHAHAYLYPDGTIEPIRGRPLKTGDLGYVDTDGYVRVTGRAKDVIIRGGVNISPLEIDAVLCNHEEIAEAASFAIPDPVYGEAVASWIVTTQGSEVSPDAIAQHCTGNLPFEKCPVLIEIVDALPRNNRGKIDRIAIREQWDEAQRERG